MTFFWCFGSGMKPKTTDNQKVKDKSGRKCKRDQASSSATPATTLSDSDTRQDSADRCQVFTYQELAAATNNFRPDSLIGRGGFGAVFKGKIESTGQDVAVKKLDEYGVQGDKEFLVEVLMLSLVHHENLVKLIGYCAEGDQRILVYEYMPLGSLEDYIQNSGGGLKSLDLKTRLQIALGAAKGLDHLHNEANVIYRDLKTANILLDHDFNPKLSDFGLAKLGPTDDMTHVSTRVMGTHGYCAPEYALTGKLTMRSDVYSFGVVLLELISGRKAISDSPMGYSTRTLAQWAHKMYVAKKIRKVIDPKLRVQESYVHSTAIKTLKVAFMCLREHADARPLIKDVVDALIFIAGESKRENNEDNSSTSREDLKKKLSLSSTRMLSILEEEEEDEEETKRDLERERAVAEAKAWAKNWRAKLRGTEP